MILAVTGHRPEKLGGYGQDATARLGRFAVDTLKMYQPDRVAVGLAQGWDTAIAMAASFLGIPFDAYLPGTWQADRWPDKAQQTYRRLLAMASTVTLCVEGPYQPAALQVRNMAMVDVCDMLMSLWDGERTGGTYNCVQYAAQRIDGRPRRETVNLWRQWLAYQA